MEELKLPKEIQKRASIRSGEYAWKKDDIPKVLKAAREAYKIWIYSN